MQNNSRERGERERGERERERWERERESEREREREERDGRRERERERREREEERRERRERERERERELRRGKWKEWEYVGLWGFYACLFFPLHKWILWKLILCLKLQDVNLLFHYRSPNREIKRSQICFLLFYSVTQQACIVTKGHVCCIFIWSSLATIGAQSTSNPHPLKAISIKVSNWISA